MRKFERWALDRVDEFVVRTMSTEETSKAESTAASKEDSKPVTQAISAKQKQAVVSDL